MGAIMLFLKNLVIWVLSGFASRVLLGAGVSFVTYTFGDDLVQNYLNLIVGQLGSLPASVFAILQMMGVGDALSIMGSALLTVVSVRAAGMVLGIRMTGATG